MNILKLVAGMPLAHALGWTLIHFCWQGSVIGLALLIVLGVVRRSAPIRYAACCGALFLMMLLPILTFVRFAAEPAASGSLIQNLGVDGWVLAQSAGGQGAVSSPWLEGTTALLNRCIPWLLGFWIAGVVLLLGRLNLGLLAVRSMKAGAVDIGPSELQRTMQQLCGRLGIKRSVQLAYSERVEAPTVIGWLRPAILMSIGCLSGLSAAQIEAVLAHELAHVRRNDFLVSIVQSTVESLLFYHPAVWWVSRQLRTERELCCDDLAVQVCGDRLAYAKALTLLEARRAAVPATALGANGGLLTMRIKRLLGQSDSHAPRFTALSVLSIVLITGGLCIGSAVKAQSKTGRESAIASRNAHALPEGYQRWVNQDVRWIITPVERKAFLKLRTDQERDAFIEQFWARRNPAGAAPGTFKRVYFSRIAFANEHFATKLPGWETDRGHIYIVYGPPDSIQTMPRGGQGVAKPYQVWHYHQIRGYGPPVHVGVADGYQVNPITRKDVDFKFVDTCGCGEYKLQGSPGIGE